jgi:hypothetical protein
MTERDIQDAQWRLGFFGNIYRAKPTHTDARLKYWEAVRDCAKAKGDKRREGEAQREITLLRHSLLRRAS